MSPLCVHVRTHDQRPKQAFYTIPWSLYFRLFTWEIWDNRVDNLLGSRLKNYGSIHPLLSTKSRIKRSHTHVATCKLREIASISERVDITPLLSDHSHVSIIPMETH